MRLTPSDPLARLRRRTIIDIALRRQRPGTGSLLGSVGKGFRVRWPDLTLALSTVPWAVAGAVATRLYMPERMTRDLDIVVLARDAARVQVLLADAGFTLVGPLAIGGASWVAADGTPVDVIEGRDRWVAEALPAARVNRDEQGLPILPLPYLVLMKLSASRVQDVADVTRMLSYASADQLDNTRAVVREHAVDLAEDLESLIHLGKLEAGEPSSGATSSEQ